jgi:calcium-dependent protein kinase
MGCTPYKNKSEDSGPIKPALIISPGTFMKMTDKKFTEVYQIGKKLGAGAYAEVHFCTHIEHNIPRAVKIINKRLLESEASKSQFISEINILKMVDHPNIVRAIEFFEDDNQYYIVMEHCQGGELFDEIIRHKQFTEYQTAQIVKQVLGCVIYLHGIGVVHRDLKPENLLLEEKDDLLNIKLIDFGIATRIEKKEISGMIGTPSYIAPEVITGKYNEKCDVWSVGVIMYILLSGFPPFQADTQSKLFEQIKNYNYVLNTYGWEFVSKDAKNLIKNIFTPQKIRISAESALNHSWLVSQLRRDRKDLNSVRKVLNKLIHFKGNNKLEEATKLFIITQLMSNKDIKEARDIFRDLDLNGDGKLSREELLTGYKKFMPVASAMVLVDKIMIEVDTNNSGYIDYNEFLKAAIDVKSFASPEYLQSAFNLFDKDRSGKISLEELKTVLEAGAQDDHIFEGILKQVDKNGDGEIDIEEFAGILKKMRKNSE